MDYDLLTARTVTQAQRMAQKLERGGLRATVVRVPPELSGRGCGYAVRLRSGTWEKAQRLLTAPELQPIRIFRRIGQEYREAGV